MDLAAIFHRIETGDLSVAAPVVNLLETKSQQAARNELLHYCSPEHNGSEPAGRIIGITGPPGVGKSSLVNQLIQAFHQQSQSVALLAVDPSSQFSGGSFLGDRARVQFNPKDPTIFVRSMAAAEKLGGLAPGTQAAAHVLTSLFDIVFVETVGVGQSETDIIHTADLVLVAVQPGSGDTLQFLKAGIMEVPDILVVTKADLGPLALSTQRDLSAALRSIGKRDIPVITTSVSTTPAKNIDVLAQTINNHLATTDIQQHRVKIRQEWALAEFRAEYGNQGITAVGGMQAARDFLQKAPGETSVPGYTKLLVQQMRSKTSRGHPVVIVDL